jgi:ATP-binding cassette, subfamily B, bacterial IrtA/YbtP
VTTTPLHALGAVLRPVRGRLIAAVCVQAFGVAAGVMPFVAVAEICRALLSGQPLPYLIAIVGLLALPVRGLLLVTAGTLSHVADSDMQLSLRRKIARHLGRLPLGWFTEHSSSTVKRAVTDDVSALHHLVGHTLLDLTSAVVVPLLSTVYLLTVSPPLAIVALLPVGVGLLPHRLGMREVAARMPEYLAATGQLDAAAVEFVNGIGVVKVFGRAGKAHQRFRDAVTAYGDFVSGWAKSVTPKASWGQIAYSPLVALAVVLAAGTALAVTPADLVPFAMVGVGLSGPVLAIGYGMRDIRMGCDAAVRIGELLAVAPLVDDGRTSPPAGAGARVEFDSVEFSYDGGNPVLKGIDLVLRPGTVTALVGSSGAGKSTLAGLLARFHDVTSGAVRINGVDIRSVPTRQLYRWVGFVPQDVRLLRASVADNIRLGRPNADLTEVRAAASAAHIHDRISVLDRGYETVVHDDVRLSGGEAQRVSIARALLADAPILVLDEATAAADPGSEAAIRQGLSELISDRTVLMIAHRLSTVVDADQIVVLDGGMVVERGRHDDLLAANGRYAALWRAQEVRSC